MKFSYVLAFINEKTGAILELENYDTLESCGVAVEAALLENNPWGNPDKTKYLAKWGFVCIPKPIK